MQAFLTHLEKPSLNTIIYYLYAQKTHAALRWPAAIAQKQLDELYEGQFSCRSAGMSVQSYHKNVNKAASDAVNNLECGDLPYDTPTTKIQDLDFSEFDLIFVLSPNFVKFLKEQNPEHADKFVSYSEAPVPDPFDLENFPENWETQPGNYQSRTDAEIQRDYEYVAGRMRDEYTPNIINKIQDRLLGTAKCCRCF